MTVGAGFLFAWIRSFEDYIRALFLTGPNTDVLTIWMFSRIRQLDAPGSNAVPSLIVFAIAIALAVTMNYGNVIGYVADRNRRRRAGVTPPLPPGPGPDSAVDFRGAVTTPGTPNSTARDPTRSIDAASR